MDLLLIANTKIFFTKLLKKCPLNIKSINLKVALLHPSCSLNYISSTKQTIHFESRPSESNFFRYRSVTLIVLCPKPFDFLTNDSEGMPFYCQAYAEFFFRFTG